MKTPILEEFSLPAPDRARLDGLHAFLEAESRQVLGYPCSALFDYSPLFRFLAYPLNNIGDPFAPSNFHLNTHVFEREVLEVFRELTGAPEGSTWGYVTNGGTEGNHYGLLLAREILPDGVVYYSQDAHYSIDKILRCLRMRSITIRSLPDGRMDLGDLRETLRAHRDTPAIVCANVGTTMKGAVDDIAGVLGLFGELAIRRHYVHADAALSGMILPFLEEPPPWCFRDGVDSVAISGHKMIGSPVPCGVVLARKEHVERISQSVEYVGTLDTTISGSRNGITPLFLWYAWRTIGREGFTRLVRACLDLADETVERLLRLGRHAYLHPYSNTVVFDRPSPEITRKWQLACQGALSHLIVMPHVRREQIDRLIEDLKAEPPAAGKVAVRPAARPGAAPSAGDVGAPGSARAQPIVLVGAPGGTLLEQAADLLGKAGINILRIEARESPDCEVGRLFVEDRPRALSILHPLRDRGRQYGGTMGLDDLGERLAGADWAIATDGAVLVRLRDDPGELARLLHRVRDSGAGIESVHHVWRGHDGAVVALTSSAPETLKRVLGDSVLV